MFLLVENKWPIDITSADNTIIKALSRKYEYEKSNSDELRIRIVQSS